MNAKVGIILVNYNGSNDTLECIESLRQSTYKDYEIYVVDNDSNEEQKKILKNANLKGTTLIWLNENGGFSKGNNVGISAALKDRCNYVWLLNNDTLVEKNTLSIMLKTAFENLNAGITGCKIYYQNPAVEIWYSGGKVHPYLGTAKQTTLDGKGVNKVTFITGCSMLIPREVIEKVGYLSEKYFLYFEDTDYCCKVQDCGYDLLVTKDASIVHKIGKSTVHNSDLYLYYIIRNRFIFIHENIKGLARVAASAYSFLSMLYKFLKYRNTVILRGFSDYKKGIVGKR